MVPEIFGKSPPSERSEYFHVTTTGNFEGFHWNKSKVERKKPATFPYKTAMSEANVKTNLIQWGVQNGPITKNRVLRGTTLFFENFVSR